jgi:hypothetical protein
MASFPVTIRLASALPSANVVYVWFESKVHSLGTGVVGAVAAEDPFHQGRVSALAEITAVDEVLRFAESLLRLGCSAEVACATAQLFGLRSSAVLHDVGCDDMGEFEDPTHDQWRRTLGNFDLDEADRLCDLVAGD